MNTNGKQSAHKGVAVLAGSQFVFVAERRVTVEQQRRYDGNPAALLFCFLHSGGAAGNVVDVLHLHADLVMTNHSVLLSVARKRHGQAEHNRQCNNAGLDHSGGR